MLPIDELRLELKDFSLLVSGKQVYLTTAYNIVHKTIDTIISSGAITRQIANYSDIETLDALAFSEFQTEFETVKQYHKSRVQLGGYSLFDLSLVLDKWEFKPNNGAFDLAHPISGNFDNQPLITENERPTLLSRFERVLSLVLPPTAWALADSPNPEELRVWCSAVAGADHYNVYSQGSLLGSVPSNNKNTLVVMAGTYQVRLAPVASDGTVGILSNTVFVDVATSATMIESFAQTEKRLKRKRTMKSLAFWRKP